MPARNHRSIVASEPLIARRSVLLGALGLAAGGLLACTSEPELGLAGPSASATATLALPTPAASPEPVACEALENPDRGRTPLWETAMANGIVYGSSTATWQISDREYADLFAREVAIMFTEDDLLWYRLRPSRDAPIDFSYGDDMIGFAEDHGMLVLGAHLVWDEGFGKGWTQAELFDLDEAEARELLFGTVEATAERYRGRVHAWIVANEVLDGSGMRFDVPWVSAGRDYVAESFRLANSIDPDAMLLLNDFGYETDDGFTPAADRRATVLGFLDELLADDVPVHALGVQAHLQAGGFAEAFDADAYRTFLADVAARGLRILITEMDVLDDGLPADARERDRAVADTVSRYLETALDEPAVVSLVTFGLSDRYTWLQEDYPREDGEPRRPLPFDEALEPKPAFTALESALAGAPLRSAAWVPPRCG